MLSTIVLATMLCMNFDAAAPLASVTVWYALVWLIALGYYAVMPRAQ
jgi:hypothetical protein